MKSVLKKMLWKFLAKKLFKKFVAKSYGKSYKRGAKWDKYSYHGYQSPMPWGYGAYDYDRPKYSKYHKGYKRSGWKKQATRYIAHNIRRRLGAR